MRKFISTPYVYTACSVYRCVCTFRRQRKSQKCGVSVLRASEKTESKHIFPTAAAAAAAAAVITGYLRASSSSRAAPRAKRRAAAPRLGEQCDGPSRPQRPVAKISSSSSSEYRRLLAAQAKSTNSRTACSHCAAAARYAPMARESGKASEPTTTTTTTTAAPRHKIPAIFTMYIALYTLNILTFCHVIQIFTCLVCVPRARLKTLN
ncbi:unnamed protein product [Trichogramma brassicae]|uniref:Uncharacterized protein n=1 Tax=Trichogramma brassicae TaxID=86971 RepID=A0A6H5ID47_9HYME|nr:unnamed protein product [Trichogramma brassicae]